MTMPRLILALASATAMFSVSTMIAYAHSGDECLSEETEKCLDDDDFWGCYDFILEQCPSHDLPHVHAPADLNRLKLKVQIPPPPPASLAAPVASEPVAGGPTHVLVR